jgi:hypothetical protein
VRAIVIVLRGRLRQFWRSLVVLSLLVAVAGGFVLAATAAARRTEAAIGGFVARHGSNVVAYSAAPLPRLARLPEVRSAVPVLAPYAAQPLCPSCTKPIDSEDFLVNEVPPGALPHLVALLSGRMPDQSNPHEVLASFTLARDNGVRIGTVLRVPLGSEAQLQGTTRDQRPVLQPAVRVVGIVAAETEFPSGAGPHYDLYATRAFAAAANRRAALLHTYYVRFAHGPADLAAFDSQTRSLGVYGTYDEDQAAAAVQASIRPQVIGWYVLAGLAALAALAVIGQAVARQAATERADHPTLAALGLRPRDFVLLGLVRAVLVGAAGAAGAVLLAAAASPLTPVGVARLAVPWPVGVSADPVVLPLGALGVLAAVVAVAAGPAVRDGRLRRGTPPLATPVAVTVGRAAGRAGLPASAVIGIRHALERGGRDGQPAGTALLGTVLAVTALCATAVFGASLAHLLVTPALYGTPFQAYFANNGTPGSQAAVNGPLLASLRRDPAMTRITLASFVEVNVNGRHVRAVVMTPVRGPVLLSAVDGRVPAADREIMLGVATMRDTGARVGQTVAVTVSDPAGAAHQARFTVTGRAALNAATGGLGSGAVLTIRSFVSVQCPPGPGQPGCQAAVRHGIPYVILVSAAPGPAGRAALARHVRQYRDLTYQPAEPASLVDFGESVNFPLLFGAALSLFGAATLVHLLLVSVARRRREAGLLKSLGFVRRQLAAAVCWQASTVAGAGIVIGVPAGIAAGRALWRLFATNFGVVPVPVVHPLLLAGVAAGVLAAANLLAAAPAVLAARSDPARLLRAE